MENKNFETNVLTLEQKRIPLDRADRLEKRLLRVRWNKKLGELMFLVSFHDQFYDEEWIVEDVPTEDTVVNYIDEISERLKPLVQIGNPEDVTWEDIMINLDGLGRRLFEDLIPKEVGEIIREWPSGICLNISTNETWIPWELIYDGSFFWGEKFIITRLPRIISTKRGRPRIRRAKYSRQLRIEKILNVLGGDISTDSCSRVKNFFASLITPSNVVDLERKTIGALVKESSKLDHDLMHYTCHGYKNPAMLQISDVKQEFRNLSLNTIENVQLKFGCLVFMNSCLSGVPSLTLNRFSSFGWEFYLKGAGAFIGTLGEVPVDYALDFSEKVYGQLKDKSNSRTIGEVLWEAKKESKGAKNIFWMLYSLYGDPETQFTIQ